MKKSILGVVATALLSIAICFGIAARDLHLEKGRADTNAAYNADISWSVEGMDENSFVYGETIVMPRATAKIAGQAVSALVYVTKPSGVVVAGDTITLNQTGKYSVCFYVNVSGKVYKTENSFIVNAPFVSVGEASSAVIGAYTGCGASKNNEGYLLRIANGEEITFNKLIDISALTKQDTLFCAFVTPDERGTADFNRAIFTLTDAVDESCSLTIVADRVVGSDWGDSLTYFKAAGENQTLTGVESFGASNEKVHVNNEYGACITHSFIGQDSAGNLVCPAENPMIFSYDTESQSLKVSGTTITDLDNTKYYKSAWSGFPSGKARLTISASGYNSKTANLCITEIFGMSFEDVIVEDSTPPEITIDTEYERLPVGEVGCVYPIPVATATDDYIGTCAVNNKVYFDYGKETMVSVPVKDGTIYADKIGTYTIVYTACDYYGNRAEKLLQFNIAAKIQPLSLQLPAYEAIYECGEYVAVQEANSVGGTGAVTISKQVYYNGTKVPVKDGKCKLSGAGEWKIVYIATDYTGKTTTDEVVFVAQPANHPVFAEAPVLPKIFLNGCSYTLEEYYAEIYTSNSIEPQKQLCTLMVRDSNGERVLNAGEEYVPQVEKSGDKVTIVYHCDGQTSEAYEIPVVIPRTIEDDEYKLDVTEYLYGEGLRKTAMEADVAIEAIKSGDLAWTFANTLLHECFSIEFNTVPGKDLFAGLQITLTDSLEEKNAVSVILEKRGGKTYLRCGNMSSVLTAGFENTETTAIQLEYTNGAFRVGNASVSAQTTIYGKTFDGFKGEKVYLTVTMLDAEVGAQYNLRAISLNRFNENTADYAQPSIVISNDCGGCYNLNDIYVLLPAYVADVLSPNCNATMTVYTPSNEVAMDVYGLRLENVAVNREYTIRLSEYGQYKVKYTAIEKDWFNNKRVMQYTISVYDNIAPEIVLKNVVTTGKVGEVYRLPTIEVTDNIAEDEDLTIRVYAYTPAGKLIYIDGGIRFSSTGKYGFRVIALDGFGNAAYREFSVWVA